METRVSFFLIAGYLIPGVVFGFLVLPPLLHLLPQPQIGAWVNSANAFTAIDGVWITVLTFLGLGLLALLFSLGVALSELYYKLIHWSGLVPRDHDKKNFEIWCESKSPEALLKTNWRFKEAYVFALTQGADVYGFAGRVRMMGASGLAITIAGIIYLTQWWWRTSLIALVIGAAMVLLAGFRTRNYQEWIAANAALFLVSGCKLSCGCLVKREER